MQEVYFHFNLCSISKYQELPDVEKGEFGISGKTHNLEDISKRVEGLSGKIDKELSKCYGVISPYVLDFYKEFPNANCLLRYPWKDTSSREKLIKKDMVFSVSHFKIGVNALHKKVRKFSNEIKRLKDEYGTGTWTRNLSRRDIKKIAELLPDISKWKTKKFLNVKKRIQMKYKIEETELTEAIDKIKEHLEFSKCIGIEPRLKFLQPRDISSMIGTIDSISEEEVVSDGVEGRFRSSFKMGEIMEELYKKDPFLKFLQTLSYEKLVELYSLYKFGIEHYEYLELLPEVEARIKSDFTNKIDIVDHFSGHALHIVRKGIIVSLEKLGGKF